MYMDIGTSADRQPSQEMAQGLSDEDALRLQAHRIRESRVLGRPGLLRKLFDHMVDASVEGRVPREVDLAIDVFSRGADFNLAQDSTVRVYIHKLRQRLAEYYAGEGHDQPWRLHVPKGEYRLVVESVTSQDEGQETLRWTERLARPRTLAVLLGISLVLLAAAVAALLLRPTSYDRYAIARADPIWSWSIAPKLPTVVVVADYYMFGEANDHFEVTRLIRDFSINSLADLEQRQQTGDKESGQYIDLDLRYLPTSVASALSNVLPIIDNRGPVSRKPNIVLASDLTPEMIRNYNIIYIGPLSGMGILRDSVFGGSRFSMGESYDDIIDSRTHKHYISQAAMPRDDGEMYQDYGYFSSFNGPRQNHIVIIAGARDAAVMQTAEAVTHEASLAQLKSYSDKPAFEALYEVTGMNRININASLIAASTMDTHKLWNK